ncbi:hypothetical protein FJ976_03835 [Mesorhizobium sp. B1-1-9]|nr:hypothetical protein FJ978_01380 [Mesorhizobium sp. B1-1-7]TPN57763.1 hypothetical protein FJ976_03835 [Mesorhizobium sp. B1-1-9]
MVAGEPNEVLVKHVENRWIVRVVESGESTVEVFATQALAEDYVHNHRNRLGLPGKPPVEPMGFRNT